MSAFIVYAVVGLVILGVAIVFVAVRGLSSGKGKGGNQGSSSL